MADRSAEFRTHVERLQRHARADMVVTRVVQGLFFGLMPALALALAAGTVALPFSAPVAVAVLCAAGAVSGLIRALASRLDRRRLLLRADDALKGREVISTAAELSGKPGNAFQDAIVEDAAALLSGADPRTVLGPRRLPLALPSALAAAVTAALLLFPVDLRALFQSPEPRTAELAQIGEDLRNKGEKLAEEARARNLDKVLELSEELAQLGKDLAARRIPADEAQDRLSELESGFAQEYQLRLLPMQSGAGQSGDSRADPSAKPGGQAGSGSASPPDDKSLRDLEDALNGLRGAQRQLGRGEQAQVPGSPGTGRGGKARPRGPQDSGQGPPPGADLPGAGTGQSGQAGDDNGASAEQGPGGSEAPGDAGGSGIGALPAPQKRGPASRITEPGPGPSLSVPGSQAEGDSTRLLARSLPEWNGSRLPEGTVINQYAQAAESALRHDEVPLSLRQAVKEYFTTIGISH